MSADPMQRRIVIAIIILAVVVPGAIYAISPYFTESTIDEEFPIIAPSGGSERVEEPEPAAVGSEIDGAGTPEEIVAAEIGSEIDGGSETDVAGTPEEIVPAEIGSEIDGEALLDVIVPDDENTIVPPAGSGDEAAISPEFQEAQSDGALEPAIEPARPLPGYVGEFVGVGDGIHDARGTASVYATESDASILRLEDFFSTNGPGLRVYLSADKGASDYVSLGDLKANRGNQNYEIPAGTDLERYNKVLIWCEPFSVLFGSAEITRAP